MTLPSEFNYPFRYAPHPLVREAAEQLVSRIRSDAGLHAAFADGKMLGVMLVRRTADSPVGCLYAFSGSVTVPAVVGGCVPADMRGGVDGVAVGGCVPADMRGGADGVAAGGMVLTNNIEGFVPPIYDLLDADGFFRKGEEEVSELNLLIYRGEKAGKDMSAERVRRRELSEMLQRRIFDNYRLLNARGEQRTIGDIARDRGMLPPGGTGDCSLPKLLQFAYANGLKPLVFGEFWYGEAKDGEVRTSGRFYPSCTSKCGFILPFMLEGLDVEACPQDSGVDDKPEIVYEDSSLIVVSKPSGMLSVPGKEHSRDSLIAFLQRRDRKREVEEVRAGELPAGSGGKTCNAGRRSPTIFAVHRLDMDTSGLMVFARTPDVQSALRRQFEERSVEKTYVALLEAPVHNPDAASRALKEGDEGLIDLPLAPDFFDRPRQRAGEGRASLTHYKVLKVFDSGEAVVLFMPLTGRTHQLRVHSAHPIGLGRPIAGDRLYGGAAARQLCLCAVSLSFDHPVTRKRMSFELPMPSWTENSH